MNKITKANSHHNNNVTVAKSSVNEIDAEEWWLYIIEEDRDQE